MHLKVILVSIILFLAVNLWPTTFIAAIEASYYAINPDSIASQDSAANISSVQPDTAITEVDTINTEDEAQLDEPIFSDAKDSLLYSIDGKKVFLYGDAEVKYESMELKADYIEFNMETNIVFAKGLPDSTGTIVGKPVFKEGEQVFRMDEMRYNFDTKKAKITGVITEEADGFLHSKDTKLMPDKSINIAGGKFTTCDLDHPHFYIGITKAKAIPDDKLIFGPAYIVIADVPFPVGIPFGFFPNQKGRSSGLIIPEYGEERNRGFFLRNGGFYFGINDYFDLKLTGDIYSKGSWASKVQTTYRNRYRYSGSFSFSFSQNVVGEKGYDDYVKDRSYWLKWNHSQDPKANPNSTFQAKVNLGSPSHNRFNAQSVENFHSNSISSSISYSKVWPGTPFSMSSSMNHSQNNLDSTINIAFPKFSINMNRIYPFKRKESVGAPAWYEKIGLSYSGNLDNSVNTRTDSLLTSSTFDKMQNGVQHKLPISTSFNILNHINVSPSANYTENWYTQTIEKQWDPQEEKVVTEDVSGFKRAWQYNTSLSISTKLYGMYSFKSKSKVQAIRHVVSPSVSLSYRPDFSEESYGFYKTLVTPNDTLEYSIFQGTRFGGPGSGKSGTINFSLGNNLEMKILTPKDTAADYRKIKILESFNLRSSYNMLADSMKLSPVSLTARTKLFDKFNINFSSTFDPYMLNGEGHKVDEFEYRNSGKLFRLTSARAGISFSLSGESRSGDSNDGEMQGSDRAPGDIQADKTMGRGMDDPAFGDAIGTGYSEYVDFDVPWNLRVDYSFSYSKQRFDKSTNQSMSFSGDIGLTPNWRIGFTSGYDFKNRKLTTTSLNFYRDLHCWEMSLTVIPIGYLRSFSFQINVKSGTLRDLKMTKRESHYDN
ncbi:MAG: putative LPS assembly protein LptD [Bacteroidales bacterium]